MRVKKTRTRSENGEKETHKTIREAMARKATEVCVRVKETARPNDKDKEAMETTLF